MDVARLPDQLHSFSEIADRTEGKPAQTQRIEHTMGDSRPALIDKTKFEQADQNVLDEKRQNKIEVVDKDDERSMTSYMKKGEQDEPIAESGVSETRLTTEQYEEIYTKMGDDLMNEKMEKNSTQVRRQYE